jgi:hypothetical protein
MVEGFYLLMSDCNGVITVDRRVDTTIRCGDLVEEGEGAV